MPTIQYSFDRAPYCLAVSYRGRNEGPPPDCRPEPISILDGDGRHLATGYGLDIPNTPALFAWLDQVGRNVTIQARRVRRSDDAAAAVWIVIGRLPAEAQP